MSERHSPIGDDFVLLSAFASLTWHSIFHADRIIPGIDPDDRGESYIIEDLKL